MIVNYITTAPYTILSPKIYNPAEIQSRDTEQNNLSFKMLRDIRITYGKAHVNVVQE